MKYSSVRPGDPSVEQVPSDGMDDDTRKVYRVLRQSIMGMSFDEEDLNDCLNSLLGQINPGKVDHKALRTAIVKVLAKKALSTADQMLTMAQQVCGS